MRESQRVRRPFRRRRNQRDYGIDLLRILSMYFVVVLHTLGNGGILTGAKPMGAAYCTAWFFSALAQCAVNCYAMISGYVGLKSRTKYTNIIMLWLQVVFYAGVITWITSCINPELVGEMEIKAVFMPVFFKQHWYFSAYFCLFFFMPILNMGVEGLTKKQLEAILLVTFLMFSVLPTALERQPFHLEGGYSVLWLVFLYVLGAYFRKHGVLANKPIYVWLILYFLSVTIAWGSKMLIEKNQIELFSGVVNSDIPMKYISPAILLSAISLLGVFSQINPKKGAIGIIQTVSSITFGTYLIHTNPFVWMACENMMRPFLKQPVPLMILTCLGVSLLIFLSCLIIELLRVMIFGLFGVKKLFMFLEKKIVKDLWKEEE